MSGTDLIKVSDYLADALYRSGIRHVFMISGGGAMHMIDSVGRHPQLKYVCAQHEQALAIAAEGYARACGKLAAVLVTSGPGGTNTLTGVIGQWLDSIPAVYLSGQVKQETTIAACPELRLRQLGDQEINIIDIVRPVTKYAVMVRDPSEVPYHLERAVRLAAYGRPGPVWLDVPLDVQAAMIEPAACRQYDPKEDEIAWDHDLLRRNVSDLLGRFRGAERPVLLAGHGIRLAGAAEPFIELVDTLGVPVLTAICGHDLIWSDHPLFVGRPGICGDRPGNLIVQNCDLFLAVGARLGVRQISYDYDSFARGAFRAMVDVDDAELRKPTLRLHMPIHADAGTFIEEMLQQLKGCKLAPKSNWLTWCRRRSENVPSILDDNPYRGGYVSSYLFADTLFRCLEPGALVVTGNGTAYTGTFQIMHLQKGVRVFTNQGCASMGYDLPAAIGACYGRDRAPVILITGDGSIQMNIQELQTIVAGKLPIKIFLLDNQGYLSIRITQDTYFQGRYYASAFDSGVSNPDFCRVAEAYGLATARIDDNDCLEAQVRRVLATPGPVLCVLRMDPKQTVLPKLSSRVAPDGRLISCPLEDMYPFLPREEFVANMLVPPIARPDR
jgi:acetolactate synthase-1/2/3 large subunit